MTREAVQSTALLVTDSNVFFRHLARRIENLFENVHIAKNIQDAERKLEEFSFTHVVGIIPFGYYDKPIIDFVKKSKRTSPSLHKTAILAFEDLPNSAGVDAVLSLDDNLTSIIEALRALSLQERKLDK